MTVLVAQTAVNIAEAYYVGFLGTDALAGAALVFPIFMLMTMMSNGGLGSGVAASVARAVGAGRNQDANALLFHAIVLAVFVGAHDGVKQQSVGVTPSYWPYSSARFSPSQRNSLALCCTGR